MAVAEILRLWREGERLLESIEPTATEHQLIHFEIVQLRDLYRLLTEAPQAPSAGLFASEAAIERAAATFERARAQLSPKRSPGDALVD